MAPFEKKQFYQLIFFFLLVIITSGEILANELDAYFVKGNEYYQNGKYKAAIDEYNKMLNLGYESWEVYYNLGNAYFKDRSVGKAILNYERAKRLSPKNEDIEFNLSLANLAIVDRITQLPQFFLFAWISNFVRLLDLQTLGFVTITIYLIWILLVLFRIFLKTGHFKRLVLITMLFSSIVLFIFAGIFVVRIYENETKIEGIVLVDKVDVSSAPGMAGTEVFTLHEGVKLQIKDRSGEWAKIRLADGKVGWLKQEVIEKI